MTDLFAKIKQADGGEVDAIIYINHLPSLLYLLKDVVFTESQIKYLSENLYKYPYSTWFLGFLYLHGLSCLEKDYKKAFDAFSYSADNGCIPAFCSLGYIYHRGMGVHVDYVKAFELYTKAISNGNINATNNLGHMYTNGLGVPINYVKAIELFTKANSNGNIDATNNLGHIYTYGLGVPINYVKAIEFFTKASDNGNIDATNNLAILYKNGIGLQIENDVAQVCAICTEEVNEESILSCMHEFHENCINEWLKIKKNCPICRKTVLIITPL